MRRQTVQRVDAVSYSTTVYCPSSRCMEQQAIVRVVFDHGDGLHSPCALSAARQPCRDAREFVVEFVQKVTSRRPVILRARAVRLARDAAGGSASCAALDERVHGHLDGDRVVRIGSAPRRVEALGGGNDEECDRALRGACRRRIAGVARAPRCRLRVVFWWRHCEVFWSGAQMSSTRTCTLWSSESSSSPKPSVKAKPLALRLWNSGL